MLNLLEDLTGRLRLRSDEPLGVGEFSDFYTAAHDVQGFHISLMHLETILLTYQACPRSSPSRHSEGVISVIRSTLTLLRPYVLKVGVTHLSMLLTLLIEAAWMCQSLVYL